MTTLSLSAVGCLDWESGIALSADHLLGLELSGKSSESWLNLDGSHTSSSKSEDEMEGRFLLDIVIRKSSSVFELLTSEDESLLIWGNTFFILNLGLNVFDGVSRLNVKSDCLSCKGFDKNLHLFIELKQTN